jgi:hypothetical protein
MHDSHSHAMPRSEIILLIEEGRYVEAIAAIGGDGAHVDNQMRVADELGFTIAKLTAGASQAIRDGHPRDARNILRITQELDDFRQGMLVGADFDVPMNVAISYCTGHEEVYKFPNVMKARGFLQALADENRGEDLHWNKRGEILQFRLPGCEWNVARVTPFKPSRFMEPDGRCGLAKRFGGDILSHGYQPKSP